MKKILKYVKWLLIYKSKNKNMLEKIFLFKFREMVYREVCDFFYEILFDIRYFMV